MKRCVEGGKHAGVALCCWLFLAISAAYATPDSWVPNTDIVLTRGAASDAIRLDWPVIADDNIVLLKQATTDPVTGIASADGWEVVQQGGSTYQGTGLATGRHYFQLAQLYSAPVGDQQIIHYRNFSSVVAVDILTPDGYLAMDSGSYTGDFSAEWRALPTGLSTDLVLEVYSGSTWQSVTPDSQVNGENTAQLTGYSPGDYHFRLRTDTANYGVCNGQPEADVTVLYAIDACANSVVAETILTVITESPVVTESAGELSWASVAGADYYRIETQAADGSWVTVETLYGVTSYTPNVPNTAYRISACHDNGLTEVCSASASYYGHAIDHVARYEIPIDPAGESATTNYYGALRGQSTVSNDGSYTYNLPIEVPPGINGMQPNLALTYNSNARNGIAGIGWSLAGQSMIARCRATQFRDGEDSTINNGDNYRFCLDGQRLVETESGEYRTEAESFAQIEAMSGTEAAPDYWTLTTTAGDVLTYGDAGSVTSGTEAERNDGANPSDPMMWYLKERRDVAGNYLTYHYTSNPSAGEHTLSHIDYTKNDSVQGINHRVVFDYETRLDQSKVYAAGSPIAINQRLTDIVTRVNTSAVLASGEEVSRYTLTYQSITPGNTNYQDPVNTSRIVQIDRCFNGEYQGANAKCAEPLVLNWADVKAVSDGEDIHVNAAVEYGDFNGDGLMDAMTMVSELDSVNQNYGGDCDIDIDTTNVYEIDAVIHTCGVRGSRSLTVYVAYGERSLAEFPSLTEYTRELSGRVFDLNEREPVFTFTHKTNADTDTYLLNSGLADTSEKEFAYLFRSGNADFWRMPSIDPNVSHAIRTQDITGDGLPDLLVRRSVNNWELEDYSEADGGGKQQRHASPGQVWDVYRAISESEYEAMAAPKQRFVHAPDYRHWDYQYLDDSGNPITSYSEYMDKLSSGAPLDPWDGGKPGNGLEHYLNYLVDVDGDQRVDLVQKVRRDNRLLVSLNTGSGFATRTIWFGGEPGTTYAYAQTDGLAHTSLAFGDFNGDGLTDIQTDRFILINTGSGFIKNGTLFAGDYREQDCTVDELIDGDFSLPWTSASNVTFGIRGYDLERFLHFWGTYVNSCDSDEYKYRGTQSVLNFPRRMVSAPDFSEYLDQSYWADQVFQHYDRNKYVNWGDESYPPLSEWGHVHPANDGSSLGDFNGDGLTDIVFETLQGLVVWLSTGAGFAKPEIWSGTEETLSTPYSTWSSNHIDANSSYYLGDLGTPEPIYIVDVNGDGRDDIFYIDSKEALLSTGTGFTERQAIFGEADDFMARREYDYVPYPEVQLWYPLITELRVGEEAQHNPPRFSDINGDGLPELIDNVRFALITREIEWRDANYTIPLTAFESDVKAANPTFGAPYDQGIPKVGANRLGVHTLQSVVESGRTIALDYAPLSDHAVYQPTADDELYAADANRASTVTPTQGGYSLGAGYSVTSEQWENGQMGSTASGTYAVGDIANYGAVSQFNRVQGSPAHHIPRRVVKSIDVTTAAQQPVTTEYQYVDLRVHRNGFGNLGFVRVIEKTEKPDEANQLQAIHTVRDFHVDVAGGESDAKYQLAGKLKREQVYVAPVADVTNCALPDVTDCMNLLSDARNRWKVRTYENDPTHPAPHFFAYVYESSQQEYDLVSGNLVQTSKTGNYNTTSYNINPLMDNEIGIGAAPDAVLETATDVEYHEDGVLLASWTLTKDAVGSTHAVTGQKVVNDNIISKGNRRGLVQLRDQYAYKGQTVGMLDSQQRQSSFVYQQSSGQLQQETHGLLSGNAAKLTTSYLYNGYGTPRQMTESWASTPNDGLAFTSRVTDIEETYLANGQRTVETTNALNQVATVEYDHRFGQPTKHTDVNLLDTVTTYDVAGRMATVTDHLLNTTTNAYIQCSDCFNYSANEYWYVYSKTRGLSPTKTYYDATGRELGGEAVNLNGTPVYSYQTYDKYNRVMSRSAPFVSNESPQLTQVVYDILDRVRTTTHPDQTSTAIVYDGLTETQTNREGQTQTRRYNHAGWILQSVDNAGTPVDFTYYPFGDLQTTIVDNNNVTRVEIFYDNIGRKTKLDDPNTGEIEYTYNPLGLLATETDGKDQVTQYEYDELGRQIKRIDPYSIDNPLTLTERTHHWRYDLLNPDPIDEEQNILEGIAAKTLGKLVELDGFDTTGDIYTEIYDYDSTTGLPKKTTTEQDSLSFSTQLLHDEWGRPLATTYPVNAATGATEGYSTFNVYNQYGFLSRIDNPGGMALWVANEQDARGNITQFTLGNGVVTNSTYDEQTGRIKAIHASLSGNTVQQHSYIFSPLGNLTERTDHRVSLTQSFCYDNMNRLVDAGFAGCSEAAGTYQYDALGNITERAGQGTYSYGAWQANGGSNGNQAGPNAVTSVGGTIYAYDTAGNLESVSVGGTTEKTVVWSAFNKPTQITEGSNSVDIIYGPHKQRIKRIDNSGGTTRTTQYLLGRYEETTQDGTIEKVHYLGDYALYIETVNAASPTTLLGSQTVYQHRDHIGSIVARTMAFYSPLNTEYLANDPWGDRREQQWDGELEGNDFKPNHTARGFTDHEHLDGVSLIHMNGRVYDPTIGRFLSPDPLVQAPNNTQSYNRYSYVFNNPLSYTDPSGYSSEQVVEEVVKTVEQTGDEGCGGCSFEIDFGGVGGLGISGIGSLGNLGIQTAVDVATMLVNSGLNNGKSYIISKTGKIVGVSSRTLKAVAKAMSQGNFKAKIQSFAQTKAALSGRGRKEATSKEVARKGGIGGAPGTKSLAIDANGNFVRSGEVQGPFVDGQHVITSKYGVTRTINGAPNDHAGVDLVPVDANGNVRTDALAISGTSGTLVNAGVSKTFGNFVLVKTNGGDYVFYAHLASHASNIPTSISVGTHLGVVGNTGRSTGLHLHVEIRQGSWRTSAPRLSPGASYE